MAGHSNCVIFLIGKTTRLATGLPIQVLHTAVLIADRPAHMLQVVYKRYASLYFVMGIDESDNELITLEIIHHYVEILDRYFGNVCELDLIFNFHKVRLMVASIS